MLNYKIKDKKNKDSKIWRLNFFKGLEKDNKLVLILMEIFMI